LQKPNERPESWRATTLAKAKSVVQTPTFKKAVKKLKTNQKKELDKAVRELMAEPTLGEQKKGNLAFLRVYKFKMDKQLTLLGYGFDDGTLTLELMAIGSHENFYRDIKRRT
jgi:mRNA-degrading endonuclease RelE of RelBE toxin-antitoxin system